MQICKILGLTGVDLFTPSDVVERRNTRRVCICIRTVSIKSRSMNINVRKFHDIPHNLNLLALIFYSELSANVQMWWQVPDFDIVTCMVAMPKDMVRFIRRSIELSQSILADSSNHHLQNHPRRKSSQVCP